MASVNIKQESALTGESVDQTKAKTVQKGTDGSSSVKKQLGFCGVCAEEADGFFFGALVCLPCKSFYVRTLNEDPGAMRCTKNTNNCTISGASRSSCKLCRFNKCLQIGMARKFRPDVVEAGVNQELCAVCQDISNGVHFGALTCEGCKKFFRRSLKESSKYICRYNQNCMINPRTRNDCRYCRYQKCLKKGMSKDVKIGRPRKEVVQSLTSQSQNNHQLEKSQDSSSYKSTSSMPMYGEKHDHVQCSQANHLMYGKIHEMEQNLQANHFICGEDEVRGQPVKTHDIIPHGLTLDESHQIHRERNQVMPDPIMYGRHDKSDRTSRDQVFLGSYPESKDPSEELCSILGSEDSVRGGYLNTDTYGDSLATVVSKSMDKESREYTEMFYTNSMTKQQPFGTVTGSTDVKTESNPTPFDAVNFSTTKEDTFGNLPSRSSHSNSDLKVAKHKLSEKENECSCHKLRRLAIENMNVPLPMKTMLIQKMEFSGNDSKPASTPGMPAMLGMMNMMSKMTGMTHPGKAGNNSQSQTLPQMPEAGRKSGSQNDVPHIPNPMNFLSVLESFKSIKCPFCSNDGTENIISQIEDLSSVGGNGGLKPDTVESDAVCLVHHQEDISTPMSFSHIPPFSSNCICLQNLQHQHSKDSGEGTDNRLHLQEQNSMLSQIHIRPGTPRDNVSDFTTMLENMMDQREDFISSHKHIHATPQACTDTIDKLRMLLKVFGIQEVQPKPNINFEKHIFMPAYWLQPILPDERIMLDMKNKTLLETIGSAYNHLIMIMHEKVNGPRPQPSRPDQFPMDIVRKRTIRNLSHWITFIKSIPGFVDVDPGDQFTIVRLAGMMGIMLATALHQYDPEEHNFTNFYNFEFHPEHPHYHFRHTLLKFGCDIQELRCDFIESAMMNACMAIATDFPNLESEAVIQNIREDLLEAFRSYTTAKYGTPNGRVEEIFSWIPRLRDIGLWNYKLSFSTCFSFEEKASANYSS